MPELFIELFSEEIPARMQPGAAATLARLVTEALAPLQPQATQTFHGPRRIALAATVAADVPAASTVERGPRTAAPPQALEGFLRKHGATRDQLADENGHWVLTRSSPATPAADLVASALPPLLRRFSWPKSMRWGNGSGFTWVRPLRRITCLLDGAVVPFALADNTDDGHGLVSGNETEGHRFHAPGPFPVTGLESWQSGLLARHVIPDAAERRRRIEQGIATLAAAEGLTVVPDEGLLDEVAGLVEWPVALLGRIDAEYMDLPPEVMQVSMRVNQRYFALRTADGAPAPRFAFAANIEALDGGATIIAGNERVLRARFSDARHFWDLDRKTPLADRVTALAGITFHAKLGTQRARVARIEALARDIAPSVGADPDLAAWGARLAKADLTTGMVGEFPELQGVIGSYYAKDCGEPPEVVMAIRDHYAPRGPADPSPIAPVTIAVALADKIDQLAAFFAIGEEPTGSGDQYGLRRAGLGIIRIIREQNLNIGIRTFLFTAQKQLNVPIPIQKVQIFLLERLRVKLRSEGYRVDILSALFNDTPNFTDDINFKVDRVQVLSDFLDREDGRSFLTSYKRAANILRLENRRDGPHTFIAAALVTQTIEDRLEGRLLSAHQVLRDCLGDSRYSDALTELVSLSPLVEEFFDTVTVNSAVPEERKRRLGLLDLVVLVTSTFADFSKIEG